MLPTGPAMAETLGRDGTWWDPLWRVRVELTPLEQALVRTWPVRRLAFVAFAGASAVASAQSTTRLEHSLGVLALAARYAPDDTTTRTAALLHDVGHLPFSHTLEPALDVDHHALGAARIGTLDPLLRKHGTSADEVVATLDGERRSVLTAPAGLLKLDHLDGLLRSATSHGRAARPASEMLDRVTLVDGAVSVPADANEDVTRVIADEALLHSAPANVAADAALRYLVQRLLMSGGARAEQVADWTDDELWAALLSCPATAEATRQFRTDPGSWRVVPATVTPAESGAPADAVTVTLRRFYLTVPLVDGVRPPAPPTAFDDLPALPVTYRVAPPR